MIKRITKTKVNVNINNKHSFKLFSKMKFMASLFEQQYFQWLSLSLPTCGPKTSPSTHCLPHYNRLPPTSWQKLVLSLTTVSACCCLAALSRCGVCQQSSATEPSATLSLTSCSTGLLLARYTPLKNLFRVKVYSHRFLCWTTLAQTAIFVWFFLILSLTALNAECVLLVIICTSLSCVPQKILLNLTNFISLFKRK